MFLDEVSSMVCILLKESVLAYCLRRLTCFSDMEVDANVNACLIASSSVVNIEAAFFSLDFILMFPMGLKTPKPVCLSVLEPSV